VKTLRSLTVPVPVPTLLTLADGLASALSRRHARVGVHGGLCPDAVLVDPDGQLTLLDPHRPLPRRALYAAPEQSGRLSRDVDERADLYALGAILYELATGQPPFGAARSAELVRAQLTGTPPPAVAARPDLPPGIDGVLATLLARLPEDRYQSASGVLADVHTCQEELAATGEIGRFPPGRNDVPGRLAFTGRLYGRRSRLGQLVSARERVARDGGVELVPVSSDPGLGKTALLGAFSDTIVMAGGWVARTAFEVTEAAPYAALARLLADLVEHLTMRCGGDVSSWRARLVEDLGGTAPVLAEFVPELRALFDGGAARYPAPPRGRRAEALLRLGIRRLLSAVSSAEAPLVLILDDLHRADADSVEVLRYVLSDPESTGLLAVAALRPKEIPEPVNALLRELGPVRSGGTLSLRPLPDSALTELLADTLRAGVREAGDLARVVADKTGSRPLAVAEFLRGLRDNRLLLFDQRANAWRWERIDLADAPPVQDVLPVIRDRLGKLPARVLQLLQVATILGGPLDAGVLAKVTGVPPDGLLDLLRVAVREGLLAVAPGPGRYRWPHEVVRRAVGVTLHEPERGALAAAIAHVLLPDATGANAHLVVELCPGGPAGAQPDRAQLAARALAAGQHAFRIGAVRVARGRLLAAVDLLPPSGWARRPPLAYAVHLHAALTSREAGDLERADGLLDRATGYAADDLARAEVLAIRARWRRADGQFALSRTAARQALDLLGVALPADAPRWAAAARAAGAALTRRLADANVEEIASGLTASDPRVILALEIIGDTVTLDDPADDWGALLAATGVRLAFDFGPTPAAAAAFAGHAAALARQAGHRDPAGGDEGTGAACAARIALALVDKCPAPGYAARVAPVVAQVRALWYDPQLSPLVHLDRGYRSGIEDGEPTLALDNLVLAIAHRFVLGAPLTALADEVDMLWRLADRYGARDRIAVPAAALAEAMARLEGAPVDEPAATGTSTVARTVGLMTACLVGDYPRALALAPAPEANDGSFLAAVAAFYHAIALAAEYRAADPDRQEAILARLREAQSVLDEWASQGPGAFDAYATLLAAERARLSGDGEDADARYPRAVDTARKQPLGTVEALAAELGGRYALVRGDTAPAVAHLRRARDCYHRWGAPVLVANVDAALAAVPTRPHRTFDQLDLLAIVRAFQAIAGELSVDRLVVTLLNLLLEHTHAERGALLLPVDGGLHLAATAHAERGGVTVVSDRRSLAAERVPDAVVEHVHRRRQPLGGRPEELPGRLANDRYLRQQPPAALLCTPIMRDDRLMAVLYLEHRHLANWFGAEHIDLLDVLCAQAAIALDNAAMHARLIEANQVLDATFDRLPVGLILLGPDLTVRRASPRAVAVTGLPIHPGTPLVDLFDVLTPTDVDGLPYRLEPGFAPVGGRSEPIHRDVLIILPGGERQLVHTSAIPLRSRAGELIGVTLLVSPASGPEPVDSAAATDAG
jgi:predicted ATPase/PAS domain-containing protein